MPDHISTTVLAIGLVITFCFRFIPLLTFLWVMIKIQKLNYQWLPLIGAAFLASALDMIPFVGHFLAVPILYFCIWKITQATLVPDATFTVALSYTLMRCLRWILLAYAPMPGLHTASAPNNFDDATNAPAVAIVQTTNQEADTTATPAPPGPLDSKIAADISVKGVSGGANNALVTIQYAKKNYVISLGEGVSISTDEGLVSVRFLATDGNNVTLAVNGQAVKYAVN